MESHRTPPGDRSDARRPVRLARALALAVAAWAVAASPASSRPLTLQRDAADSTRAARILGEGIHGMCRLGPQGKEPDSWLVVTASPDPWIRWVKVIVFDPSGPVVRDLVLDLPAPDDPERSVLEMADVDGDGLEELVVIGYWEGSGGLSYTARVYDPGTRERFRYGAVRRYRDEELRFPFRRGLLNEETLLEPSPNMARWLTERIRELDLPRVHGGGEFLQAERRWLREHGSGAVDGRLELAPFDADLARFASRAPGEGTITCWMEDVRYAAFRFFRCGVWVYDKRRKAAFVAFVPDDPYDDIQIVRGRSYLWVQDIPSMRVVRVDVERLMLVRVRDPVPPAAGEGFLKLDEKGVHRSDGTRLGIPGVDQDHEFRDAESCRG